MKLERKMVEWVIVAGTSDNKEICGSLEVPQKQGQPPAWSCQVVAAPAACPARRQKVWAGYCPQATSTKVLPRSLGAASSRVRRCVTAWNLLWTCPQLPWLTKRPPWFWSTVGYGRWISTTVQYLWCSRNLEPNQKLVVWKDVWAKKKHILCDIQQFPIPPRWTNIHWRGRKDGGPEQ